MTDVACRLFAILPVAFVAITYLPLTTSGDEPLQSVGRRDLTRMVAHWADYADPEYLPFIDAARPELVQVGFYGAHFWSLAHTPHGAGYPAHFPVVGHDACRDWFRQLNLSLHRRGVKVIGHFNVKFLVGDPSSAEGPRGFFDFYNNHWNVSTLGPRPVEDPQTMLEVDRHGEPLSNQGYNIGGMREYWACLNNPHWRQVLQAWVRHGIAQDLDGFVVNYFYRHDCHCKYCVEGFRTYLAERFTPGELHDRFGIRDLATTQFTEIGAWHDPAESTEFRRESLRFSQIANQNAYEEVFVQYGRSLKPDLILAQWNHLGDFDQIRGDERCLLPGEKWATNEDYLWYSTGDAANKTRIVDGVWGEATLQARYIRGASGDKPFTLGKYEQVRVRAAIAELLANGGMPMGFYTNFKDPEARRLIVQYYQFLQQHDHIYRNDRSIADTVLVYPRTALHRGDIGAVARFKAMGQQLLDQHVLFDVLPDDMLTADVRARYGAVLEDDLTGVVNDDRLSRDRSRFDATSGVRVSASAVPKSDSRQYHFVNYNRHEPADSSAGGAGAIDERPIVTKPFGADIKLESNTRVEQVQFLTPEDGLPAEMAFDQRGQRLHVQIPSFLVYGVLRVRTVPKETVGQDPVQRPRRMAAIVTEYRHNSHADIILSRLLQTDTLDGSGKESPLQLVSLYVDQRPPGDTSRMLAASHGFRLSPTIEDALTLGSGQLAVDGIFLIAEHGDYPRSSTGNLQYPKRPFWDEVIQVFDSSRRVVPVFIDKHLADNWRDAKYIYDTAAARRVPLMAGSSVPGTWRRPAVDVRPDAPLQEIVALTYHTTDAYGFHALEVVQGLAEQRTKGETGVREIRAVAGADVWTALDTGAIDRPLFDQAWERLSGPQASREQLRERVAEPKWFQVDYNDGLRAHLLELNGAVNEWSVAWRYADGSNASTLCWTQEGRPGMHFTYLLQAIEQMMVTGIPTWNVERTLLTSGTLDAMLMAQRESGRPLLTPYLNVTYRPTWRWREPPPPPPMRPWAEQ